MTSWSTDVPYLGRWALLEFLISFQKERISDGEESKADVDHIGLLMANQSIQLLRFHFERENVFSFFFFVFYSCSLIWFRKKFLLFSILKIIHDTDRRPFWLDLFKSTRRLKSDWSENIGIRNPLARLALRCHQEHIQRMECEGSNSPPRRNFEKYHFKRPPCNCIFYFANYKFKLSRQKFISTKRQFLLN